ncbi:alpha/beta fold hydrolase [Variovorax sp. J22P271]|uniref:alpha/beta hydrolase n=1 Tax=Variovorax davisae TaxID=3053515 RepID=UPI0025755602|nr:alpha/beta fold hydrolase [Variovorax sp. J22P271]MDM0033501.1 alpha/beta fold hydrolase [Variovorax sp. J22P271]
MFTILKHSLLVATVLFCAACATGGLDAAHAPLVIQDQGSFAVGGKTLTDPDGKTFHGDHAYVSYQIPAGVRKLPLVFWHGAGQSSKTWETTPDGREGFQNLFLRRGHGVYLMDQPRRGRAGRSAEAAALTPARDEQLLFNIFRLGNWPDFHAGVQFSRDPAALDQYFRQMTPNTGPFDMEVTSDAAAALFRKIGPGVLVTHSQGGGPGWLAAMKSSNIRAVVAYEPGSGFVFPAGEVPPAMPSATGVLEGVAVPLADFLKLTRIPIVVYYGDNIPDTPSTNLGADNWRVRLAMARLWTAAINRHGGDAVLVHLPEIGIRGNTHFPFSDTNNVEIAEHMAGFLAKLKSD